MVTNQLSPFLRVLVQWEVWPFYSDLEQHKVCKYCDSEKFHFSNSLFFSLTMKHQCVCLEKEGSCHLTTFILEISLFTQLLNLRDPIEISPSAGSESSSELTETFWPWKLDVSHTQTINVKQ